MPGPPRILAGALLALAAAVALVACDDPGADLQHSLVGDIPGYSVADADSGPLSLDGAASSLPTPPDTTGGTLRADGFTAGYSRVFLKGGKPGGDYVIVAAYALRDAPGAEGVVAFEHSALGSTGTVALFSVDTIAKSVGFVLTGATKRGDRQVFCDGVIFPKAQRVYAVTTCSGLPIDATLATAVARRQALHTP